MRLGFLCRFARPFLFVPPPVLFRLRVKRRPRDQLNAVERSVNGFIQKIENPLRVLETDLHLGGMHIDVNLLRRELHIHDGKRKAVLHEIRAVAFLQSPGEDVAL